MIILIILNIYLHLYILFCIDPKAKQESLIEKSFSPRMVYSSFIVIVYIIIFIIFLRVLRLFSVKDRTFDLKLVDYSFIINNLCLIIINIFFLIIIIYFLRKFVFIYFRYHLFSIYYNFFTNVWVKTLKNFWSDFDRYFINILGNKNAKYFDFVFNHGFKIVIITYFFKNIIFDSFEINLKLLPFYGAYYTIISIHKFAKSLKHNFDFGLYIYHHHYEVLTLSGIEKVRLYKDYVMLGYCQVRFVDPWVDMFTVIKGTGPLIIFDIKIDTTL